MSYGIFVGEQLVESRGYRFDYVIDGHRFTNQTGIIGEVPKTRVDANDRTIVFDINAIADGRLVVLLPKTVIQSVSFNAVNNTEIEIPFRVSIDDNVQRNNTLVEGEVFWPEYGRTHFLAMEFPIDAKKIAIMGTYAKIPNAGDEPEWSSSIRFLPSVPTEGSEILVYLPIFYPDLCHSADFNGFSIDDNVIDFHMVHYQRDGACPELYGVEFSKPIWDT